MKHNTAHLKLAVAMTMAMAAWLGAQAQNEAVTPVGSLSIVKEVKPPILELQGQVAFVEPSGNRAIDAGESCSLKLTVKNTGLGDGYGLRARISTKGNVPGVTVKDNVSLPVIKVGDSYTVEYPITANLNTVDGTAEFLLGIDEPNGLNMPEVPVKVATRAFLAPMVEFRGHVMLNGDSMLKKNKVYNMDVTVQNTGKGVAERVNVSLALPDGVIQTAEENTLSNGTLAVGQSHTARYSFIVPQSYSSASLPISVNISESYGRYSKNGSINLSVDQKVGREGIIIEPNEAEPAVGGVGFDPSTQAQCLEISEPVSLTMRQEAVDYERTDLNGDRCALLIMHFDNDNVDFEGDIRSVQYRGSGEWWIWMTKGSNWLTVKTSQYTPTRMEFEPLKSGKTYKVTLRPATLQMLLTVTEPFHADMTMTDATKSSRVDANGRTCALVRIGLVMPKARFEGSGVVHSVYRSGEWWVWLSPGATKLTVKAEGYQPLELQFEPVMASVTYLVTILKAGQQSLPQPQTGGQKSKRPRR